VRRTMYFLGMAESSVVAAILPKTCDL
jgi:hypothetical protein